MKNLFNRIKWSIQRAYRGYDDRIELGYGADLLIIDALPRIKRFCLRYIFENQQNTYNKKKINICSKTINLIDSLEDNPDSLEEVIKYIGSHICWYWD